MQLIGRSNPRNAADAVHAGAGKGYSRACDGAWLIAMAQANGATAGGPLAERGASGGDHDQASAPLERISASRDTHGPSRTPAVHRLRPSTDGDVTDRNHAVLAPLYRE